VTSFTFRISNFSQARQTRYVTGNAIGDRYVIARSIHMDGKTNYYRTI